jgi:nicotinamidase-related amidase
VLLQRSQSSLLIVDVQERLTPVMTDPRRVIHNCHVLIRSARRLGIPVLASEQYPKGLGATVVDLREEMPAGDILAKTHFSAAADPQILARIEASGRRQVAIAGIESHVCVLQTAIDLAARGFQPAVVMDACASRRADSEQMAWGRLRQEGVPLVSVEMALFEWLHQAGSPEFKELSTLIR